MMMEDAMSRKKLCFGALGFACAISHQAAAEERVLGTVAVTERASEPNGRIGLDSVVASGSRLGLTSRETPATVYQVDRETIEARGARDTQEVLRGVPGMTASAPPGGPGFVSYRGFTSSQLTQLFNGITVQYDAIAARPVDSWIYDRVEVIGGPSTYLFGAGAVGGSVNYVTKTAERHDFQEAQVRLGSYDTKQVSVGLNRQISGDGGQGNFLRADFNQRTSNGWVDGNSSKSDQFAASLLSDISNRLTHTLALEYQNEQVTRPYWGTPLLNPVVGDGRILDGTRFKNYNTADGLYQQRVTWVRSLLDFRLSEATQVKNTFYLYDALRDYRNVETYKFNAADTLVNRTSALLQRHDQGLAGDRIEVTHQGLLGNMKSDWAFGADFSVNSQTRYPRSITGPVAGLVTGVNPLDFAVENFYAIAGMSPTYTPDRTNRVRTLALFVENRTRLLPKLSLVTGIRHDRINLQLTNQGAVTPASPAGYSRSYAPTTGRIGLVWDIAPSLSTYVQYSTAADPPSGILSTASFADVMTNSELTTGRQLEAGSKFDFLDGRGSATVAVFGIERKNLSTPDPANPGTSILVGAQSSRGVELAAGMRLTKQIALQGNLALVDAQYDTFSQVVGGVAVSRAGNTPQNVPKRVANLWADYAFASAWKAGVGVRHVSAVFGDAANTFGAPGYTLYDAKLDYRINKSLSLTARLRNLTDKIYAANVTGAPMFFLGEPRSADIALRLSY